MPKTGFFGQKPISVVFRQIPPKKIDFHKNDYFYRWSDAVRRADSEYHLWFSSKRNMEA